jgi:hypothetical protein
VNKKIGLNPEEQIELIYVAYKEKPIEKNIIVLITNQRVVKFSNDNTISDAKFSNIKKVRQQLKNLFSWNKLVCDTDSGIVTFGVYHTYACEYLCDYINDKIKGGI